MPASSAASVAIIIPIYRISDFLEQALASATRQILPASEILVVDDGSPAEDAERIAAICSRFPEVRLLRQPHGGAARARSFGAEQCSADYIIFLDADDILQPIATQLLSENLQRHPDAVASYAQLVLIDENGTPQRPPSPQKDRMLEGKDLLRLLLQGRCFFNSGSICITRRAMLSVPTVNHGIRQGEDWMLYCYLALHGTIIAAGETVVLHYRKHAKGVSARFLEEAPASLTSYERVYSDPAFAEAIGEETFRACRETCYNRLYTNLTAYHIARGEPAKAQEYFRKITAPLTRYMPPDCFSASQQ